jgi:hypothetical protein
MRVSLLAVGLLVLTVSAAGTTALDLHGTARAGDRFLFARRALAGARIRIPGGLTAQIAAGHQWRQQIQRDRTALDVALTNSHRRDVESRKP